MQNEDLNTSKIYNRNMNNKNKNDQNLTLVFNEIKSQTKELTNLKQDIIKETNSLRIKKLSLENNEMQLLKQVKSKETQLESLVLTK